MLCSSATREGQSSVPGARMEKDGNAPHRDGVDDRGARDGVARRHQTPGRGVRAGWGWGATARALKWLWGGGGARWGSVASLICGDPRRSGR